jgi:hypothetical protein
LPFSGWAHISASAWANKSQLYGLPWHAGVLPYSLVMNPEAHLAMYFSIIFQISRSRKKL